MSADLPKQYDPAEFETRIYRRWLEGDAFRATPDTRDARYVVMMPLPNVTGALHMGHAMDNVMQDLLTRWHRMMGDNTLWQPGTDHAGIATQAIVEKRLLELEGKTRHDIGRDGLVQRIWQWKEEYQARIIRQQQMMGCGCDWNRQRFTMDAVCARAVRWAFFGMFRDGLIYRGDRLVNWDCHLETAVSDDEIEHVTVAGHFWHLRYPVIDPAGGEPQWVTVATTRPETMLGDTAVACHPHPDRALDTAIASLRERLASTPARDRAEVKAEIARLEARRETHLPELLQLAEMARARRQVRLPLQDRPIPLITDEWAKPELGSGCVKITPAHDPNDYEVWKRHRAEIGVVNILETNGRLNANAGVYAGLDRFEARERVVADLRVLGLLERVEDREVEIGHSDRSKTPIEPYLSKQWFVFMGDVDGGIVCGRGTENEFRAAGLAQAAIDVASGSWSTPSGRRLVFWPDSERYGNTYRSWLAEKRDWCISRQLWWGHRIPIWKRSFGGAGKKEELETLLREIRAHVSRDDVALRIGFEDGTSRPIDPSDPAEARTVDEDAPFDLLVGIRDEETAADAVALLERAGLERDPDVLDTWFSSALWPLSTLGWPNPETAGIDPGQTFLGRDGHPADSLSYYYPGSCLATGRDIITLWVVRMQLMGLYCLGDVPFTDCFIHANILDGKGERMSKSKGNGIDPADIIDRYGADAMRYVLCDMQTGMQDIRLPVQAVSPFTGKLVDLATARHGRTIFTYLCPETGKEFDVLGSMPGVPAAKVISERFEVGRNFANKLWNAARFVLSHLSGASFQPRTLDDLRDEDRWILSRYSSAIDTVQRGLEAYNPSLALNAARDFFWSDFCDWYVELVKPRMRDESEAELARQVLAVVLDGVLRILHPFIPFVTEALWESLAELAPERGIERPSSPSALLACARWPASVPEWKHPELEERIAFFQDVVRGIRDVRAKYDVKPRDRIRVEIRAEGRQASDLEGLSKLLSHIAGLEFVRIAPDVTRSRDAATAVVRGVEIYIPGVVDLEAERARLAKQRDQLLSRIEAARRKLANENFVARANPDVVARERERLLELEKEFATVEASFTALGERWA